MKSIVLTSVFIAAAAGFTVDLKIGQVSRQLISFLKVLDSEIDLADIDAQYGYDLLLKGDRLLEQLEGQGKVADRPKRFAPPLIVVPFWVVGVFIAWIEKQIKENPVKARPQTTARPLALPLSASTQQPAAEERLQVSFKGSEKRGSLHNAVELTSFLKV